MMRKCHELCANNSWSFNELYPLIVRHLMNYVLNVNHLMHNGPIIVRHLMNYVLIIGVAHLMNCMLINYI